MNDAEKKKDLDLSAFLAGRLKEETGKQIAEKIRAELVCCDIYDKVAPLRDEVNAQKPGWGEAYSELQDAIGQHDICYWGEVAARIAENPK